VVRKTKREGSRIVLSGGPPDAPAIDLELSLVVSNGTIRFHDLGYKGRSMPHMDVQSGLAQQAGLGTMGEVFRVLFALKSCEA
jgi:hypothetical protein